MLQDDLSIAGILQEFREDRKLSRRGLSQKAGLSASYIGKLEAGEVEPSVKSFLKVARALSLSEKEVQFCIRCALVELSKEEG